MLDTKFYLNKESCQKSANQCNIKKDAAKLAQEQSSHVYLSILLKNMTESKGMVIRDAIVVQVLDSAFDVLVPEFGLEKRVHVDQLPLERHAWVESSEILKLYWNSQAFKQPDEESNKNLEDGKEARHAFDTKGAMDHPDDATNAYDDERGLFDDESDYEDEERSSSSHSDAILEDENDEQATNLTKIKIFGHVQVLITADTTISPPVIKVVAMNPYAATNSE